MNHCSQFLPNNCKSPAYSSFIHQMKSHIRLEAVVRAAFCSVLLLTVACSALGQKPKPNAPDNAQLSSRFLAAFGKDFDLIKSELKTRSNARGGGTYWLAYVSPKRTGYYYLQYSYKDPDPLYSHVEREVHLGVGAKGCRRGEPYAGVYSRFCMGDTIILPYLVNNFSGLEFKLVKAGYTTSHTDWEAFENHYPETRDHELDKTEVANSAAAYLRYVGRVSHKSLHRTLGYTLTWHAAFEAVKPGRFNLLVSSSPAGEPMAGGVVQGVPIVIVARDAPITMIAGSELVRGYRKGFDGREYISSTSGNSYMTNLIIMHPGDRLELMYFSTYRGPKYEQRENAGGKSVGPDEDFKPVIAKLPFSPDEDYNFNEWVVGYFTK